MEFELRLLKLVLLKMQMEYAIKRVLIHTYIVLLGGDQIMFQLLQKWNQTII